jgi:hypothetical protein
MTAYDTAIALAVELHRIVSTMPDPMREAKCAVASVQAFFQRFIP